MADVIFNAPTNMATMFTWGGAITGMSGSRIAVSDGLHTAVYLGSFTYSGTDLAGTLTGFQQFTGSTLDFAATGLQADAHTVAVDVQTNQLQNLFSYVLSGSDNFYGSSGADVIMGFAGSDNFLGNQGNDTIDGGDGIDTAFYHGTLAQHQVSDVGGVITVADTVAGRDGTDTLLNVEQLHFDDTAVVLDLHGPSADTAYLLYQAAYAREPDVGGFRFWATQAEAHHMSALDLAHQFIVAPEFTQKYGANPTNSAYATALYGNVLGRAPDAAGLSYWVDQLNHGASRDQMLVNFALSAENVSLTGSHRDHGYWVAA